MDNYYSMSNLDLIHPPLFDNNQLEELVKKHVENRGVRYREPEKSEIYNLEKFAEKYGYEVNIGDLLNKLKEGRYQCPKCNGKGTVSVKYDAYPPGLPDSGFANDWRWKDVECDLCNGIGYTKEKYVPNMVQDGWKVE